MGVTARVRIVAIDLESLYAQHGDARTIRASAPEFLAGRRQGRRRNCEKRAQTKPNAPAPMRAGVKQTRTHRQSAAHDARLTLYSTMPISLASWSASLRSGSDSPS